MKGQDIDGSGHGACEKKKAGESALPPASEHQTSLRHPGGSSRSGQRAIKPNWLVLVLFRFFVVFFLLSQKSLKQL